MIYYYLRGSNLYITLCYRPYDLWRGCRGLFLFKIQQNL
nr:MAG TPA: hypothetical protein [Caudoviricetes sp.]